LAKITSSFKLTACIYSKNVLIISENQTKRTTIKSTRKLYIRFDG
jgi:hypothetical protein